MQSTFPQRCQRWDSELDRFSTAKRGGLLPAIAGCPEDCNLDSLRGIATSQQNLQQVAPKSNLAFLSHFGFLRPHSVFSSELARWNFARPVWLNLQTKISTFTSYAT